MAEQFLHCADAELEGRYLRVITLEDSLEDRARLAEDLLASLEDGSESASEVEAAWEHEIRQRVDEVESGTAKLIPAEDVYAETRRIYQK